MDTKTSEEKKALNEKNRSIDALFILMQHTPEMFKQEMLKFQILCRSFQSEKSFQNIISKESFGDKKRTIFMNTIKSNNINKFNHMLHNYKFDINIIDTDLKSALSYACESGNIDIVTILLNNGAKMDYSEGYNSNNFINPVYFAIKNDHTDIVKLMIEKGLDIGYPNQDKNHHIVETILEKAVDNGNVEIVRILINSGFCLDSFYGIIPFYEACYAGYHEIVQALIDGGMSVECIQDFDEYNDVILDDDEPRPSETGLMCASNIEVVRTLVENGAYINAVLEDGRSALYINCERGNIDIVSYLIDKGAQINITTHDNKTPLSIACENENVEIINLLLISGADISNIDYNQYSEVIKSLFQFNEIVNDNKMRDK